MTIELEDYNEGDIIYFVDAFGQVRSGDVCITPKGKKLAIMGVGLGLRELGKNETVQYPLPGILKTKTTKVGPIISSR